MCIYNLHYSNASLFFVSFPFAFSLTVGLASRREADTFIASDRVGPDAPMVARRLIIIRLFFGLTQSITTGSVGTVTASASTSSYVLANLSCTQN